MLAALVAIAVLSTPDPALEPGTARIRADRYHALRAKPPPRTDAAWAAERTVTLRVTDGGIEIDATWRLRSVTPAWFGNVIAAPDIMVRRLTVDGRPASAIASQHGTIALTRVDGPTTLRLRGFIAKDPKQRPVQVGLLGASVGTVTVTGYAKGRLSATGVAPAVRRGGRTHTAAAEIVLGPPPPASRATDQTIAIARAAVGLTVGDAEVRGRARLSWEIRRGQLERVSAVVSDLGRDLRVEGPNVGSWKRTGDRVAVELRAPSSDRVDVNLTWTKPVPKGSDVAVNLPAIVPQEAWRTESSLQLARDGEIDFVPRAKGWSIIAARQLPTWGEGLVEGVPTAAFRRAGAGFDGDGRIAAFRFQPVDRPAAVIEAADYTVATTAEGRYLMQAHYEVSNERAGHLTITPPAGARPVGVAVWGEVVRPAKVGRSWRIPLKRSVDTVEGLLTVPVDVYLLGASKPWRGRERREFALPTVDAPVAVMRSTLHLPRDYRSQLEPGHAGVVTEFTRGRDANFGPQSETQDKAEALFKDAVDAWSDNDFERAQHRLDELESIGANTKNTRKLQSNVDVVLGPRKRDNRAGDDDGDDDSKAGAKRRIKAQARARGSKRRREQARRKRRARKLRAVGDYGAAQQEFKAALDISRELQTLEGEESAAYDFEADEIEEEIGQVQAEAESRARLEAAQYGLGGPGPLTGPGLQALREFVTAPDPPPPPQPVRFHIPIPQRGVAMRYQHLLLEPGGHQPLDIRARRVTPRP